MRLVILGTAIAASLFLGPTMAQRLGIVDMNSANLSPRFYLEASPAIVKRDTSCRTGTHPCLDISSDLCCADDQYCIIDPKTFKAACCAIGSKCGSSCEPAQFQCNTTSTTTVSGAAVVSTGTFDACCGRQCTATSMFACASSLGGGCCSHGQTCIPGKQCAWTASQPTQASTLVSMLPPGCTTSQIACPADVGGGCCALGKACTVVNGGNFCAQATVTPTGDVVAVPQGAGLSTGAKAGIGAGVAVGACFVIGAATWLCLRRRREQTLRRTSQTTDPYNRRGGVVGGSQVPPMSELTSDGGASRQVGPLRGITQDYFGPDAVSGPYTEAANDTSAFSTPMAGVPMEPQGPGDIVAPVEIDSTEAVAAAAKAKGQHRSSVSHSMQVPETIEGRFELVGSEYPSPPSEHPTPQSRTMSPSPLGSPRSRARSPAEGGLPPHHESG